jgi:hypothetical protein
MLTDRIIGLVTFRKGVFAEVERDTEFTTTAWILVVVVSFLSQLGRFAGFGFSQFGNWLISAIIGTIMAVAGFALGALVVSLVGSKLFNADVDFEEMVRTLGLAYVWNVVGFIGVVAAIAGPLVCVVAPITIIAVLLGLVAWLLAAKEALDLEWGQTIVTLIIGWIVTFLVTAAASVVLGIFGLSLGG